MNFNELDEGELNLVRTCNKKVEDQAKIAL